MAFVKRIEDIQSLDSQVPAAIKRVRIREINRLPRRRTDAVFFENTTPAPGFADPEVFTVNWA